jgi:hypothetical protein
MLCCKNTCNLHLEVYNHSLLKSIQTLDEMSSFAADLSRQTVWLPSPHGSRWDAVFGLQAPRRSCRVVPLQDLVKTIRQGTPVSELDSGDLPVHAARVGDIYGMILGAGEVRKVSPHVLRRHLLETGDVLVPRVGRSGGACCFGSEASPMIPREGLLVAKPIRREWGPVLAAALCTATARSCLLAAAPQGRQGALTIEDLASIPIPSPTEFDFQAVAKLSDEAGHHDHVARALIEHVRGEVGAVLESSPLETERRSSAWFNKLGDLDGWGWQTLERHWLNEAAQWRLRGLKPLDEVFPVRDFRVKSVIPRSRVRVLNANDLRPDWYLAILSGDASIADSVHGQAARRLFAVDRESLLIPTVGDITGEPVVVPDSHLHDLTVPLAVTLHWLPLAGLRYPRALAVVLDHPFLRLQRKLAGAFSTVTHISREEIGTLLIPSVYPDQWNAWEAQVREAQDHLLEAEAIARKIVATVEGWYT